jgi:hypothetical protein
LEHIIINADVLFLFMRSSGETAEQMEASKQLLEASQQLLEAWEQEDFF